MSHYNKDRWERGVRSPSVNHSATRRAHLKHRYGITQSDYDALFERQGGVCAICKTPPGVKLPRHWSRTLCVDHCYGTNKIRGLLCNTCNWLVSKSKTADELDAAAIYIRSHS